MSKENELYEHDHGVHKYSGYMDAGDYFRLLDIARENQIVTFDINDAISFVICNFPRKQ